LAKRYPDGQIWVQCNEELRSTSILKQVFQSVIQSIQPLARLSDNENELHNYYGSLLAEKEILIVVDQADSESDLSLLIPPSGCGLNVTSRYKSVSLPDSYEVRLGGLSAGGAEQVLLADCPEILAGSRKYLKPVTIGHCF